MSTLNLTDYSQIAWYTVTPVEYFVIAFELCGAVFTSVLAVLIFLKRNVPFVKARQPVLLIICGVGATIAQIGFLQFLRIVPQTGPFLYNGGCTTFGIWMAFVFGLDLYANALYFRMIRLYFIFNTRRFPEWWHHAIAFGILHSFPFFVHGILGSAFQWNGPVVLSNGIVTCYLSDGLEAALAIYYVAEFLLLVFLAIALRNIPKKAFSDYTLNLRMLASFIIADIILVILIGVSGYEYVWGRVVYSILLTFSMVIPMLILIAQPLYHSFVDPEKYTAIFLAELNNHEHIKRAVSKPDMKSDQLVSSSSTAPTFPEKSTSVVFIETPGTLPDQEDKDKA